MSGEHVLTQPYKDDQGRTFVVCTCGVVLRGESFVDIVAAIAQHLVRPKTEPQEEP